MTENTGHLPQIYWAECVRQPPQRTTRSHVQVLLISLVSLSEERRCIKGLLIDSKPTILQDQRTRGHLFKRSSKLIQLIPRILFENLERARRIVPFRDAVFSSNFADCSRFWIIHNRNNIVPEMRYERVLRFIKSNEDRLPEDPTGPSRIHKDRGYYHGSRFSHSTCRFGGAHSSSRSYSKSHYET